MGQFSGQRLQLAVVTMLGLAVLLVALATRPTMGAWSAQITNDTSTVGTKACFSMNDCFLAATEKYTGMYFYDLGSQLEDQDNGVSPNTDFAYRQDPAYGWDFGRNLSRKAQVVMDAPPGDETGTSLQFDNVHSPRWADLFTANGVQNSQRGYVLFKDPRYQAFTQEVWFKTTQGGVIFAYSNLAWSNVAQNSSVRLDVGADGRLHFAIRDDDAAWADVVSIVSDDIVADGQWHLAATTLEKTAAGGTDMQLFLDGERVATGQAAFAPYTYNDNSLLTQGFFRYGADGIGDGYGYSSGLTTQALRQFKGEISHVAGYAAVLPADVIQDHYQVGITPPD